MKIIEEKLTPGDTLFLNFHDNMNHKIVNSEINHLKKTGRLDEFSQYSFRIFKDSVSDKNIAISFRLSPSFSDSGKLTAIQLESDNFYSEKVIARLVKLFEIKYGEPSTVITSEDFIDRTYDLAFHSWKTDKKTVTITYNLNIKKKEEPSKIKISEDIFPNKITISYSTIQSRQENHKDFIEDSLKARQDAATNLQDI